MLNEATKEDFFDLADMQRDRPEHAMLRVQFALGGGILNPVVEHVGDLVHRMSERPTFNYAGYPYVKEKVQKTLQWLTKGYLLDLGDATDSFRREFEVNLQNNAKYTKVPVDQLRQKVYAALDAYAAEFEKLPTYNRAQQWAVLAAISVGKRQFNQAVKYLKMLQAHLGSVEEWVAFAHEGLNDTA